MMDIFRMDCTGASLLLVLVVAGGSCANSTTDVSEESTRHTSRRMVEDLNDFDDLSVGDSNYHPVFYDASGLDPPARPNFNSYQPFYVQQTEDLSYQPSSSQSYQPPSSQSYQPSNSQSYQPSSSQSYQSPNSQSYQASSSQSYQPPNVKTQDSLHLRNPRDTTQQKSAKTGKKLALSQPDMSVDESRFELKTASYLEPPPRPKRRNRNRPPPPLPQSQRRNDDKFKTYDPRAPTEAISPTPKVYPIPIEFINQIPGPKSQFTNHIPGPKSKQFNPSSQIEKVINGVPTLVDQEEFNTQDNALVPGPPYSEFLVQEPVLPPVTPKVIYREEYPNNPADRSKYNPGIGPNPPYPPVPYHDSRLTSPRSIVEVSTPGNSGTLSKSTARSATNQGQGMHYMDPPNQVQNFESSFNSPAPQKYSVPGTDSPLYSADVETFESSSSTSRSFESNQPTYGYFPPATRVMPRVSHIEAECRDDFMKLRVAFNDSFSGLIYSAGYTHDHDCMYINGTGGTVYEFYIQLNRCGTLGGSDHHKRDVKNREPTKNYMWNTVTIQYNPLIEEEWDEHFKVTCEYGYDFWKTITFPFLEVDREIELETDDSRPNPT